MNNQLSFSDAWKYPSWIESDIKGCTHSETKSTPDKFKSGRVVYKTTFYNSENKTIESRTSMQMVSKRTGQPYYVCQTDAAITRDAAFRRPTPTASAVGADVIAELYSAND